MFQDFIFVATLCFGLLISILSEFKDSPWRNLIRRLLIACYVIVGVFAGADYYEKRSEKDVAEKRDAAIAKTTLDGISSTIVNIKHVVGQLDSSLEQQKRISEGSTKILAGNDLIAQRNFTILSKTNRILDPFYPIQVKLTISFPFDQVGMEMITKRMLNLESGLKQGKAASGVLLTLMDISLSTGPKPREIVIDGKEAFTIIQKLEDSLNARRIKYPNIITLSVHNFGSNKTNGKTESKFETSFRLSPASLTEATLIADFRTRSYRLIEKFSKVLSINSISGINNSFTYDQLEGSYVFVNHSEFFNIQKIEIMSEGNSKNYCELKLTEKELYIEKPSKFDKEIKDAVDQMAKMGISIGYDLSENLLKYYRCKITSRNLRYNKGDISNYIYNVSRDSLNTTITH